MRPGAGQWIALAVAAVVAATVGFAYEHRADDGAGAQALGTVDVWPCPVAGARSIGQLHAGDAVRVVGVTGGRWAAIRRPGAVDALAWVPLAMVRTTATAADLPVIECAAAGSAMVPRITTTTLPPTTTAPTVTTVHPRPGATTTTTSTTTTTVPSGDTTPPSVTLTTDLDHVYTSPAAAACKSETVLHLTVVVADPTLPVAIRSVVAGWTTPAGPQTQGLTPVAGNTFSLEVMANGPTAGEVPLTLTATAVDGAGNVGTGTLTVSLRAPASFGCGS